MYKKSAKIITLSLIASFAVLAGCKNTVENGDVEDTTGIYYLSVLENGSFTSYESEDKIQSGYKFTYNSSNHLYALTLNLTKDSNIRVGKIGSQETFGGDYLFSNLEQLTKKEDNGSILVNYSGSYTLSMDSTFHQISYKYQAPVDPNPPVVDDAVPVFVEISDGDTTLTINSNDTMPTKQLTATTYYSDNTSKTGVAKFESNDTNIATITEQGLLTAVKTGEVNVVAKVGDLTSDPINIIVNGSVVFDDERVELKEGETKTLTTKLYGVKEIDSFTSTNNSVATIDNTGKLTAVGSGDCVIRANYIPRSGAEVTYASVAVHVNTPLESISIATSQALAVNETKDIYVKFNPSNATFKDYDVTLENESEEGVIEYTKDSEKVSVTGKKVGTCDLKVTSSNDPSKTATCSLKVIAEGEVEIEMSDTVTELNTTTNKEKELEVIVVGDTLSSVTWTSSVEDVATINGTLGTAKITALKYGSTTITANITTTKGTNVTKTCKVYVEPETYFFYGGLDDQSWGSAKSVVIDKYKFIKKSAGLFESEMKLKVNTEFTVGAYDDFFDTWNGFHKNNNLTTSASSIFDTYFDHVSKNDGNHHIRSKREGTFKYSVDMTSDGIAKLNIEMVSLDINTINLTSDKQSLKAGDTSNNTATISLSISPSDATYTTDDITWSCSENSDVTFNVDDNKMSSTISVSDNAQSGSVTITCSVNGKTKSVNISILDQSAQEVAVSSIDFEQDSYEKDIAEKDASGFVETRFQQQVVANVNADATVKTITYSKTNASDSITVDATTGIVTATRPGTFSITATSVSDTSKTDTCEVTFYTSAPYLDGCGAWKQDRTDVSDSKLQQFVLKKVNPNDNKLYSVDVYLSGQKFKVAELGITSDGNLLKDSSKMTLESPDNSAKVDSSHGNIIPNSGSKFNGIYTISYDVSASVPKVTVVKKNDGQYSVKVMNGTTEVSSTSKVTVTTPDYSHTYRTDIETTVSLTANQTYKLDVYTPTPLYPSGTSSIDHSFDNYSDLQGDAASNFEAGTDGIKCNTDGNYKFTIKKYNDGNYNIQVALVTPPAALTWSETTEYSACINGSLTSSSWANAALTNLKVYKASDNTTYKLYGSYTFTQTSQFGFNLCTGDTPMNADGTTQNYKAWFSTITNGNNLVTASGSNLANSANQEIFFEITFTKDASSGDVTLVSIIASATDLNTHNA